MSKNIKIYQFFRYDRPLNERFDLLTFKDCEQDIFQNPIYKETYYCFLLMEEGEAEITVAGQYANVKSPVLITALPGDKWEWKKMKDVKGFYLCFDAETLMSGLKGGYSLDPIPFLNPEQRFPFICLSEERFTRLRQLIDDMKECISEFPIHYDLLRAELWQFIFLAEKEYSLNGNRGRKIEQKNHVIQFIQLVN